MTGGVTTWRRQPADAFRCLLATLGFWVLAGLALWSPRRVQSVSAELVALLDALPRGVIALLVGVLQLAALVAPVLVAIVAARGRRREALVAVGAILIAAVVGRLVNEWLYDAVPTEIIDAGQSASWVTGSAFPSGAYLAGAAAGVTALAPVLGVSWRRAAWWALWVVAAARVLAVAEAPLNLAATLTAGIAVGSATLFVVGAPERRPTIESVRAALVRAGLAVDTLDPVPWPDHTTAAFEAADGHRRYLVKVVGHDQRDADLMSRLTRSLRVKGAEDDRPISPRPAVEREALNTFLAASAGVAVPTVSAVGETDERAAFLALERTEGRRLDDLPIDSLDDELLERVLAAVARLHEARLAHRWLSLDHVMVRPDGEVVLTDLRWADAGAGDELLANDTAEIIVALAVKVGAVRAVAAASKVFSSAHLTAALPRLQPLTMSTTTRRAVKADQALYAQVREQLQQHTGVEHYELLELQRLTWRTAFTLLGTAFIGVVLLGLISNWSEIWDSLRQANPWAIVPMLLISMMVTATGAWSLMGSVNQRLAFVQTFIVMYAQSFLNRFTPANAGGMALRVRYLQRNGIDLLVSAGSVGLTSAASGVSQAVLFSVFLLWAGSNAPESGGSVDMSAETVVVVLVVLAAIVGILLATAFGRRLWTKLRLSVAHMWTELRRLARQPLKMTQLFGGAVLGKLLNIVMLDIALLAVGVDIPFGTLGAMYMVANTVASAAPTPGGVGAIEAALTAGLISLAVPPGDAAAAVVLFRLISFWFPVIPGYASLRYVERAGIV